MFATVVVGIFNLKTRELRYCTAGHHPPLVLNEDGEIKELRSTANLALGLLESCEFNQEVYKMNQNEALILYTDGVPEALAREAKSLARNVFLARSNPGEKRAVIK